MPLFQYFRKTDLEPDHVHGSLMNNFPENTTAQEVDSFRESLSIACLKKAIHGNGPEKYVCKISNSSEKCNSIAITLFRMMGSKKAPHTSFSPVTPTNVGIRPQIFLTFKISMPYLVPIQNY